MNFQIFTTAQKKLDFSKDLCYTKKVFYEKRNEYETSNKNKRKANCMESRI